MIFLVSQRVSSLAEVATNVFVGVTFLLLKRKVVRRRHSKSMQI